MHMSHFELKVIEIIENEDGSSKIVLDINKKAQDVIKKMYGWSRWNTKKFEKLLIEAITNYMASMPNYQNIKE